MQHTWPAAQFALPVQRKDAVSPWPAPVTPLQLVPSTHAVTRVLPDVTEQQLCPGMEQIALPHGRLVRVPPGASGPPASVPVVPPLPAESLVSPAASPTLPSSEASPSFAPPVA